LVDIFGWQFASKNPMVLLESLEAKKIMAAERLLQASMAKSRLRGDSAGISWPVKRMGTGSQLGLM